MYVCMYMYFIYIYQEPAVRVGRVCVRVRP